MDNMEPSVQGQEQPVDAVASAETDEMQKPIYNKIQMTDVVKRERQRAYDQARRELQEQQQQPVTSHQPAPSLGGMQQVSHDDVRKMLAEMAPQVIPQFLQQHSREIALQRTADSFVQKMRAAESKYPGLENKLNELDFGPIAPIIEKINDMENSADMMHELVMNNPMKLGNLVALIHTQPKLAEKALHDLSNSIKQNHIAQAQEAETRDPLKTINPSNAGMDNGSMTTTDFMKMPWLKG